MDIVDSLLAQAATFDRAGDIGGAIARATLARRCARTSDERDACDCLIQRLRLDEARLREDALRRNDRYLVRERAAF